MLLEEFSPCVFDESRVIMGYLSGGGGGGGWGVGGGY